ncbi:unnamed protein product [Rotaria sordida]|uniref:Peptidase C1A papain C-terminal domain-containing protein n=1 Tax=Rotaria sordida TaxID=392033 RepID=A0A814F7E8_9BILA|nr:unnamed protein product [Rotaria sordida]
MHHKHTYTMFFVVLYMFNIIQATHFRGSMISWRIINESSSTVLVEILQRHAWRYDAYTPLCTGTTIANGQPILGASGYNIICVSNCPTGLTTLGSVLVPCTGYNIGEQYAMGEGRFTLNIRRNSSFVATFNNSAWFNLVTGVNLAWSVAVQIQTYKRVDTGWYNNAPIITMLPIYRLRNKISYSIKINVADNDFDPYICLWCKGSIQCGGLSNSVPGGIIDNYGCYLNFTPNTTGYYAAALTIEDFVILPINISSTSYLSQVPIQFVFHVYDSSYPCVTGPIYIGDLVPDICIYLSVGATYTTRVRFEVQCTNATVQSIISVNPTGLLTTSIQQDPFDRKIFAFLANFTSNAQQVGQNLFCFSAVDSIGNQGDSTCLRFAVSSQTSSLQPLYRLNATRYPMGTVSKTTSIWTILTGTRVYQRPTTETYIRFKRTSDSVDFYALNAVTATANVFYLNDRIVINSTVVWTPGTHFYIYFDAGVLAEANTCSKEAMPISDPNFWPFDIPYETTTTSTSSTITTSISTTTTARTIPTHRTLRTSTTTTSATTSTKTATKTISTTTTSTRTVRLTNSIPISAIVGITLTCLFICALLIWIIGSIIRVVLIRLLLLKYGLRQQILSIDSLSTPDLFYDLTKNDHITSTVQYKLATRHRRQQSISEYSTFSNATSIQNNLIQVQKSLKKRKQILLLNFNLKSTNLKEQTTMPFKTFLTNKRNLQRFRLNGLVPSSHLPHKRELCQEFCDHRIYGAQQLPPKVDLRPYMTPVEDQSKTGSCAANCLAGAYEYLTKKANGRDTDISRLFIYYNARVKDQKAEKVIDSGCTMTSAIEALEEFGTCLESIWPYDISRVNTRPTNQAYREARNHKITEAFRLNVNLSEMKSCLAQGFPFAFGLRLYASFDKAATTGVVPIPKVGESRRKTDASHALLAVGYSDQSKAFIVRNSWGAHWGDNGYCFMPYEYVTNPSLCFDVWTIHKLATDDFGRAHWDIYDMTNYVLAGRSNDVNNGFDDNDHVIETFDENDKFNDYDDDDNNSDYDRQGGFNYPWNQYQDYGGNNYWQNNIVDRYQEPFRGYPGSENFPHSPFDYFREDNNINAHGGYPGFDRFMNNSPNFFNNQFIPPPPYPPPQPYGQSYGYDGPFNNYFNPYF